MIRGRRYRTAYGGVAWIKPLLIIFFVSAIIFSVLSFGVYHVFMDAGKKATDPGQVEAVARSLAEFENPLPEQYKFQSGFEVAGTLSLGIYDFKNDLLFILVRTGKSNSNLTDEELLNLQMAISGSAGFKEKSRGKIEAGGLPMQYALGTSTVNKVNTEKLIGIVPLQKRQITVTVQASKSKALNIADIKQFFSLIKRFN